jgi:hypothetical protein
MRPPIAIWMGSRSASTRSPSIAARSCGRWPFVRAKTSNISGVWKMVPSEWLATNSLHIVSESERTIRMLKLAPAQRSSQRPRIIALAAFLRR